MATETAAPKAAPSKPKYLVVKLGELAESSNEKSWPPQPRRAYTHLNRSTLSPRRQPGTTCYSRRIER